MVDDHPSIPAPRPPVAAGCVVTGRLTVERPPTHEHGNAAEVPAGSICVQTTSRVRLASVLIAVSVAAVACGSSADSSGSASGASGGPSDAQLLDFTTSRLAGGDFSGTSIKGKDTVFWFWAPWCTVCRAEAPDIVATAARFRGKVDLIGVAGRGEVPAMKEFVKETGTGGFDHIVDDDGAIWSRFGVAAQPAFAFVDDTGKVEVVVGSLDEQELTERLQAMANA